MQRSRLGKTFVMGAFVTVVLCASNGWWGDGALATRDAERPGIARAVVVDFNYDHRR